MEAAWADAWAQLIQQAEQPAPFSPRDGRALRRVPANEGVTGEQLRCHLAAAFATAPHVAAEAAALGLKGMALHSGKQTPKRLKTPALAF